MSAMINNMGSGISAMGNASLELEELFKNGTITEDDYNSKRAALIFATMNPFVTINWVPHYYFDILVFAACVYLAIYCLGIFFLCLYLVKNNSTLIEYMAT